MRVAAIYDIYRNLPALEAVLEEIREVSVDRVVVGGNVVPGPVRKETLTGMYSTPTWKLHREAA
jgi:Icc-related predicted phosphoesterase